MPIYEFQCRSCDGRFEELVRLNGAAPTVSCPDCGSTDTARLLSVFAVGSAGAEPRQTVSAGTGRAGGCCGGACGCG